MAAKRLFASPTFRFSIRQLLVWTAFVALACVALRNASPTWVAGLLGVTLVVLTAAVPLAIFRIEGNRAFWLGFAFFGWMYVLLLAYGWSLDPSTAQNNPLRPTAIVTSRLTSSGFERIFGATEIAQTQYAAIAPTIAYTTDSNGNFIPTYTATPGNSPALTGRLSLLIAGTKTLQTQPYHDDFVNVAHAIWTILLAALGGWFTRWLYATRPVRRSEDLDRTSKD